METKKKRSIQTYLLFIVGLFISGVGVAVTKRGELGVSPVSSVANILSIKYSVLTLGNWLIVWNCVLILGQVVILRRKFQLYQFLQVPLSFLFGYFTDFGSWMVKNIPNTFYPVRILFVLAGTAILGLGIAMTVSANVIMNSGEAFVKAIAETWHKDFGNVKIGFDVSCVLLSVVMSMVFFDLKVLGTREGTIIAAVLTGVCAKFFMKCMKRAQKQDQEMSDGTMQAVIFDMDGVLFDSEKLCMDCWEKVAEEYGLENLREAFLRCTGTNAAETKKIMLDSYGQDFDYDTFAGKASVLFHEYVDTHGMPMKPGVRELLTHLKERGIPIGLASSTKISTVERELKGAGIYGFFDVVVGGDMLKRSKPAPDIYLMACEKMGVDPEETYAIEDSYNGIRSAYVAGMKPVMVPDLLPPDEEMREKSFRVVDTLTDLVNTLEF